METNTAANEVNATVANDTKGVTAEEIKEVKKMKKILDKQKKVRIKIKKKDDKDIEPVPVIINGYFYPVKKGAYEEVPESIATLLEEAGYI